MMPGFLARGIGLESLSVIVSLLDRFTTKIVPPPSSRRASHSRYETESPCMIPHNFCRTIGHCHHVTVIDIT